MQSYDSRTAQQELPAHLAETPRIGRNFPVSGTDWSELGEMQVDEPAIASGLIMLGQG